MDSEIYLELDRCNQLYLIMNKMEKGDPLFRSAYIELLIVLNDILQNQCKLNKRITFKENIYINDDIKDITDLVNDHRNAACHIETDRHLVGGTSSKVIFNIISGYCQNAVKIGDKHLGCDYDDDIAIYYGDKRIYFRRNLGELLKILNNYGKYVVRP